MTTYLQQGQLPDRSQTIKDIVDRLKKQGLFDQFRKECLADVDTKPAYQNLRHRVEGAVARFLSTQTWHPDLNKKQLRDSLRRHITESQMLTTGVDRVVEQVVNPKIYKVFKAQLDQAVCEYLGIDYHAWVEKLKQRDELKHQIQQLEQQKKHQQQLSQSNPDKSVMIGGIPSLMEIPVPPEVKPGMVPPTPMAPATGINHSLMTMGGTGIVGMNMAPGMPNTQMMPPIGAMPVGMTPGMTPGLPYNPAMPGFTAFQQQQQQLSGTYPSYFQSGFPSACYPSTTTAPPMPSYWPASSDQTIVSGVLNLPHNPTLHQILNPPVPGEDATEKAKDKEEKKEKVKKEEVEPLTVESFLNIPLPKSEPPKLKDKKKEEHQEKSDQEKTDHDMDNTEQKDIEVECVEVGSIMLPSSQYESGETDGGQQKVYHFAWDNIEDDSFSDITVSSIHTSDLSSFDEDASHDTEHEERELSDEDMDNSQEKSTMEEGSTQPESAEGSASSSPIKVPPVAPAPVKPKPKKLISLSYNYSDSDDDETREERKARIAREKEERYLRRQQRRAELEQKRKEREEEKARMKAEKQRQKLAMLEQLKADEEQTKVVTESPQVNAPAEPSVEDQQENTDKGQVTSSVLEEQKQDKGGEDDATKEKNVEEEGAHEKAAESPEKTSTPKRKVGSPRKRPKITKEEAKEILREQKVMEKRMALRRRRTRNRRYVSDEFTSIFTERKNLLTGVNDTYVEEMVVEHAVEIEAETVTDTDMLDVNLTQSVDSSSHSDQILYTVPQAQEEVVTSTSDHIVEQHLSVAPDSGHMTRSKSKQTTPAKPDITCPKERPASPYSDISTSSQESEEADNKEQQDRESDVKSPSPATKRCPQRMRKSSSITSAELDDTSRSESEKSHGRLDTYPSRLPFSGSMHGHLPSPKDEKPAAVMAKSKAAPDTDPDSAYEPISTPEHDEYEDKSDDEKSSNHSLHTRSRSLSKSRSRSPYRSRSRSHSLSSSSSRSQRHCRSRSSSSSSVRCRSVSQSHHSEDDDSSGDEKREHARVPIEKINFGEAAKRAKRKFIDDVDFGEAERHIRGQVPPPRGFPPGSPSFRAVPGRGRAPAGRGEVPARATPVARGKYTGQFPARLVGTPTEPEKGMRRGVPPVRGAISPRGGATSPRGGSPNFRPHGANFQAFQRQSYPPDSAEFLPSPEKRRPWLRSRSSESDSMSGPYPRSSKEDVRSKVAPPGEDEGRFWIEEDQEQWGRGSSSGRDTSRCHSLSSRDLKSSHSQSPHSSQRSLSSGERSSSPEEGEMSDGGDAGESPDSLPAGKRIRQHSPIVSPTLSHHSVIGHGSPSRPPHHKFHELVEPKTPSRHPDEGRRMKHISPKAHGVHEDRLLRAPPPLHGYEAARSHMMRGRLREGLVPGSPSVRGGMVRRPVHPKQNSDDEGNDDLVDDEHGEHDDGDDHLVSPYDEFGSRRLTRAGRKRSEEENAPIAKRLRHH